MALNKATLETNLRNSVLRELTAFLSDKYATDVLVVGASEITIPMLDEEGNEKYALIKVSIPRGTRNGEGGYDAYDGYAVAEDYRLECDEKAAKRAASAAKKEAAEKERERKRALRAKKNASKDEDVDDPNQYLDREIAV